MQPSLWEGRAVESASRTHGFKVCQACKARVVPLQRQARVSQTPTELPTYL